MKSEQRLVSKKKRGDTFTLTFDCLSEAGAGQYYKVGEGEGCKPLFLASAAATGEQLKINYSSINPKHNPTIDMLNGLQVGQTVQIEGPCGNVLEVKGERVLLIAAGSALTVMRNMEKTFTKEGKQVDLIYSAKTRPDLTDLTASNVPFPKKIFDYEQRDTSYITYTQENVHLMGPSIHYGRIDQHITTREIAADTTIFVCGPPEFENSVVAQLTDPPHNISPSQIYISYWGNIQPINNSALLVKRFHLDEKEPHGQEIRKEQSQLGFFSTPSSGATPSPDATPSAEKTDTQPKTSST